MAGPSTSFTDNDEILDELDDCDSIFNEISIQNEKQIIEEDHDSDCELNHSENSSENIVVNDGNLDDKSDVFGLETLGNDGEEFDQFVDNVIEVGQGDANNRVVSSLDEQKRVSRRARDTIRWLEAQFRQGNRFLRAQRANEHLALPLIKYPKKKDKEAWYGPDKYRTDIEVTNEQIASGAAPLQVRRGSEPALNQLLPSTGTSNGHLPAVSETSKRWSAAPIIAEPRDRVVPAGRKEERERGVNGHSTERERERWGDEREESPHRLSTGFTRDGCRLSMQYLGDAPG
ncbi:Protein smg5 [Homalodisca vitripennis]|nr:Protein smg5 [Homalodisca vitripennis]